jgi:hypothetical protein
MASYLFDKALEMLCHRYQRKEVDIDVASIASFFMAFKLCEIYPPDLLETVELLQIPKFKLPKILEFEAQLLAYLNFSTTRNCEDFFVSIFSHLLRLTESQLDDCMAVLEYGLLFTHTIETSPSLKAAGAIYLLYCGMSSANQKSIDINLLVHASKHSIRDLKRCAGSFIQSIRDCKQRNITCIR